MNFAILSLNAFINVVLKKQKPRKKCEENELRKTKRWHIKWQSVNISMYVCKFMVK